MRGSIMTKNLTLIDMSVIIYQTYFRNNVYYTGSRHQKDATVNYLESQMLGLITPAIGTGFTPVLIYDQKDKDGVYWRQKFIDKHQEEHTAAWDKQGAIPDQTYKGNRKAKSEYSDLIYLAKEAGERLKYKYYHLIYPGLEADDLAGLVCQYKTLESGVDLVTVDRDWAGLTDKNRKIRWINMLPKKRYSIETEDEVLAYFQKKLDKRMLHPSEAFEYKRQYSEASDNLPANCRIELIDLLNFSAPVSMGFQPAHDYVQAFLADFYSKS